jgi:hypothetical protein
MGWLLICVRKSATNAVTGYPANDYFSVSNLREMKDARRITQDFITTPDQQYLNDHAQKPDQYQYLVDGTQRYHLSGRCFITAQFQDVSSTASTSEHVTSQGDGLLRLRSRHTTLQVLVPSACV